MDPQPTWTAVDTYFQSHLHPAETLLTSILTSSHQAGLPAHEVAPNQGKLLYLLTKLRGARRVLEIGTLGAYSTVWFAQAVSANGGRVVTLEVDAERAALARGNLEAAGVGARVEVVVGEAMGSLRDMVAEGVDGFDVVFIDADKPSNPGYLEMAMKLVRVGSLIVGDNVVRDGLVVDGDSKDERVQGVRRFVEMLGRDGRVEATALQTVGVKGYDGFVIALVVSL